MATVKALVDIWGTDKLIVKAGEEAEMSDEKAKLHEKNGSVKIVKAITKELKIENASN